MPHDEAEVPVSGSDQLPMHQASKLLTRMRQAPSTKTTWTNSNTASRRARAAVKAAERGAHDRATMGARRGCEVGRNG